MTDCWPNI